jgi:large subunit ribosomal protein L22
MKAVAKQVRMSPRKVRLVADVVRGLSADEALLALSAMQKRAAMPVIKAIESAVANATTNSDLERANLMIGSITINEGQAMKRFHPSSRGRVHPYKKRGSHITIVLKEKSVKKQAVVKTKTVKANEKSEKVQEGGQTAKS